MINLILASGSDMIHMAKQLCHCSLSGTNAMFVHSSSLNRSFQLTLHKCLQSIVLIDFGYTWNVRTPDVDVGWRWLEGVPF